MTAPAVEQTETPTEYAEFYGNVVPGKPHEIFLVQRQDSESAKWETVWVSHEDDDDDDEDEDDEPRPAPDKQRVAFSTLERKKSAWLARRGRVRNRTVRPRPKPTVAVDPSDDVEELVRVLRQMHEEAVEEERKRKEQEQTELGDEQYPRWRVAKRTVTFSTVEVVEKEGSGNGE